MENQLERLIDKDELLRLVPYTLQHIYRKERAGTFPKRVKIGANRVAWVYSEVKSWIDGHIAARNA